MVACAGPYAQYDQQQLSQVYCLDKLVLILTRDFIGCRIGVELPAGSSHTP